MSGIFSAAILDYSPWHCTIPLFPLVSANLSDAPESDQMGNGAELALGGHLRHLLENFRIVQTIGRQSNDLLAPWPEVSQGYSQLELRNVSVPPGQNASGHRYSIEFSDYFQEHHKSRLHTLDNRTWMII